MGLLSHELVKSEKTTFTLQNYDLKVPLRNFHAVYEHVKLILYRAISIHPFSIHPFLTAAYIILDYIFRLFLPFFSVHEYEHNTNGFRSQHWELIPLCGVC